jgi:hypothetical protein
MCSESFAYRNVGAQNLLEAQTPVQQVQKTIGSQWEFQSLLWKTYSPAKHVQCTKNVPEDTL